LGSGEFTLALFFDRGIPRTGFGHDSLPLGNHSLLVTQQGVLHELLVVLPRQCGAHGRAADLACEPTVG
jgi:hypothetical protein